MGEHAAWATALVASAGPSHGWDPTPWTPAWRAVLAAAGVPFAASGDRPPVTIDDSLTAPTWSVDQGLRLPPVERFATLTSLPLKPVRLCINHTYQLRLQIAVGIRLWKWSHCALVINATADQQDGFLYGPQHGMRLTLSLAPGAAQELTW